MVQLVSAQCAEGGSRVCAPSGISNIEHDFEFIIKLIRSAKEDPHVRGGIDKEKL